MTEKIFIQIEDRFIKGIVLKCIYEKNLEFVEVLDEKDLRLKLEIFKDAVLFYIVQIYEGSHKIQYALVKKLKLEAGVSRFPVMALIPNDSFPFVAGAKDAGVEDVVLIPEKHELFRDLFYVRITEFLKKIPRKPQPEVGIEFRKAIIAAISGSEDVKREIKRANRGKYPVSFVMLRLTGIDVQSIRNFYEKLKSIMRDTDRIANYDVRTFIVICPFTTKDNLVEVENKIKGAFVELYGRYVRHQRIDMYGVTYPDDEKNIEKLIERLEKGVHDSSIISNIREPLNALSRERLEEYKKMLRLYKKDGI